MAERQRVVIVGGGFGGLRVARALAREPVEITLIDRRNFHLFQPLLYQVATGGLSPGDICSPLRAILRRRPNVRVLLGEVTGFDLENRRVILSDGQAGYDTLVVAAGAENHYFGHPEWAAVAPGLKTVEDAVEIRRRILLAFEAAEREPDAERRRAWLRFVVIGAGPTGVEMAGAIGEIANDTLRGDFRAIRPEESEILLLDMATRVLPPYPPDLSARAERSLIQLGVRSVTGIRVTAIDAQGVRYRDGQDGQHWVETRTVVWAAGVAASPLSAALAEQSRIEPASGGRLRVAPDLSLPGRPEVFVIGDMAYLEQEGKPLPGVAPVAMQQGYYVARAIQDRLAGRSSEPFRYRFKGDLATIGRAAAVANFGALRFHGLPAWLLWLFVHLMYLVGFENRVIVFIEWAFHYFTMRRRARLITGEDPFPLVGEANRQEQVASLERQHREGR